MRVHKKGTNQYKRKINLIVEDSDICPRCRQIMAVRYTKGAFPMPYKVCDRCGEVQHD